MIPLALVGMSYREAPSAVRAALAAFDSERAGLRGNCSMPAKSPASCASKAARASNGCSRRERPAWAAELFSAALIGSTENPDHVRPRVRHGAAAVGGLLRVAAGLDSVAQGEHAIGNQVLRAFERAHEAGTVCRSLHVAWRGVGEMLNRARRILPQGRTGGVQALVDAATCRRAAGRADRRIRARRNRRRPCCAHSRTQDSPRSKASIARACVRSKARCSASDT